MSLPEILFQDDQWLVVNKPAGWLTIPGRNAAEGSWVLSDWCESFGQRIWTVHRLDRETSGVILFAKSGEAHREANLWFESQKVKKKYLALIAGVPPVPMAMLREPIEGKPCSTQIEVKERFSGATLVQASPQSGRRHQIRIHLANWGFPILGDLTYSGPRSLRGIEFSRVALHAAELKLPTGAVFSAPLPEDFRRWLKELQK